MHTIYMAAADSITHKFFPILLPLLLCTATIHPSQACASMKAIKATAAVVMDAQSGRILYAKNPTRELPPASTTKLMTAIVVLEHADPQQAVIVGEKPTEAPRTAIGLNKNDRLTVEQLLEAALLISANDAAIALAEAVAGTEDDFVELMNAKAAHLGLQQTTFANSNGLPRPGQHTTAQDLASIMRQAIKDSRIQTILNKKESTITIREGTITPLKNTNQLLSSQNPIIGKTGYTNQARHCFVGAWQHKPEGTIIVAILGVPRRSLLWQETEALADYGYRVINNTEEPITITTKDQKTAPKKNRRTHRKKTANTTPSTVTRQPRAAYDHPHNPDLTKKTTDATIH